MQKAFLIGIAILILGYLAWPEFQLYLKMKELQSNILAHHARCQKSPDEMGCAIYKK